MTSGCSTRTTSASWNSSRHELRERHGRSGTMRILVSWLREFVDVPASADEIARTMSVRGFAVESIDAVGSDDAVIDFEITANRPDCMSVSGMAREAAAAFGLPPPREPRLAALDAAGRADIDVVI